MAIIRCEKGHFYDNSKADSCPYCAAKGQTLEQRTVSLGEDGEKSNTVWMETEVHVSGDDQKTVGLNSPVRGNDYVTGWIVCTEGPEKGRDYRLHSGNNRIGRSSHLDVCIFTDPEISRDCHCNIVYEPIENKFYLVPEAGGLTYIGDQMLQEMKVLENGDCFAIGGSSFEFVKFCREGRTWKKE